MTVVVSLLLFLTYVATNKKSFILIFVGLNLAYNTLLTEEFLFYTRGPNYDDVVAEMVKFYKQNNFKMPVYAVHETLPYYMDLKWSEFGIVLHKSAKEKLANSGGIVVWLNLPPATYGYIAKTLEEVRSSCTLIKVFRKNDIEAGYVFLCSTKTV